MEDAARVILNKLKLVDPTATTSTFFSAYQQSAEIRQLWISVNSSIHTILTITSSTFSINPLDASSQIISVLSASTLLSSIIHAIITTQRRLNKSDENMESIIKKEMQVILYHIQILKQDLNQSTIRESAQEAIIHHTDILVDSLVAFSLSPSNNAQFQLHPYKVSPSVSLPRRHSQPSSFTRKNSSDDLMTKTLSHHQYDSNNSLNSNASSREKSDTVGKKFMRSINSLKSRPAFQMTLLPNRHSVEPSTDYPPKKKRAFYDQRASNIISEIEEDPDNSDDNCWDDDSSSNTSTINQTTKPNTLRFSLNNNTRQQQKQEKSQPSKRSSTRGIKDLFQFIPKEDVKKKRESLGNLFNSNLKNKQLITKDAESTMQGSTTHSSSTSTSSAESTNKRLMKTHELDRHFLISPTTKQTNILSSVEEDSTNKILVEQDENYSIHDSAISSMEEDTYHSDIVTIRKKNSRKRRSNGSLVAPKLKPPTLLSSTPMTRNNSPLPPLPTVENFLTIMDAPASPDSSYFSARSTSSSSSSQSTLNSISLDNVTDNLAKTHISDNTSNEIKKLNETDEDAMEIDEPPTPPPKDHLSPIDRRDIQRKLMDPQNNTISNMNNKQEKRTSSSSLKRNSLTEMRVNTNDISKHVNKPPPKSADANLNLMRPPIPPRTSSMPLPPTPPKNNNVIPPLPADAKKKASAYNRRSSAKTIDENTTWGSILGSTNNKKDELIKRAKLGRSLGAVTPNKKLKKSDNNSKLLKVTENGNVVLFFEMIDGRLQAIAGTTEKLFERLADETTQDEEYVDIYLMSHTHFISCLDLLNLLINRFHLEPSPGEYEYFKKWQFSIQTKVLNVIERWILFYYQDFKYNEQLLKRLNSFLYNDHLLLGIQFKQQLEKIRSSLKLQGNQFSDEQDHLSTLLTTTTISPTAQTNSHSNFNFHFPFVNSSYTPPFPPVHFTNSPRRPSNGLFNLTSLSTPPDSPSIAYSNTTGLYTSFASLESKDIARYLTLADYYLFKLIQVHGLLNNQKNKRELDYDYVELMTKRANMLSHWVVHEICSISYFKPKRALLKKFIEIAKLCLELNNFHTCMVITMGLSSAPKLKDIWDSLSNRDMNTFTSLQKLLDVSLNMRHYRQKIQLVKSPSVPFLPVVLKDQTFYNENSTFSIHHPELINFSKFRSIFQFKEKMKLMTQEPYWFANDLTKYSFLPALNTTVTHNGQLDSIGDWLETRLSKVEGCYLYCELLNM